METSLKNLYEDPGKSCLMRAGLAFLARGDFHARSCFVRPTIPEEKWGLLVV